MNDNEITKVFSVVLIVLFVILVSLLVVYVILLSKTKKTKEEKKTLKNNNEKKKEVNKENVKEYTKESIFSFLEFDKIEDNMIITKNGNKFIMAIECQGINYDLMSGLEKNSVEQGFIQFLNTLRYPIQLYIQTRTVNLESGLIRYREKLQEIKDRLLKKQMEYNKTKSLNIDNEEINNAKMELTREQNLYEYGLDIINNTERMSLNRNILRKHYYVIISYIPEEASSNNYDKDEISNMAFSELYTKAQSIISSLSVCGVNGKILNSDELVDLLYVAYNRDESEIYDIDKAKRAGYDELYSTSQDVLEKRMKEIDKKIKEDAERLANDTVLEVIEEDEKQRQVREKEEEIDRLISEMAKVIIKDNKDYIGKDITEKATKKIDDKSKTVKNRKTKEKGGKQKDEKK